MTHENVSPIQVTKVQTSRLVDKDDYGSLNLNPKTDRPAEFEHEQPMDPIKDKIDVDFKNYTQPTFLKDSFFPEIDNL